MSDRDLAVAAWGEFSQTTDSYPAWVKKGRPASSHWAKGKALLDQIDVGVVTSNALMPPAAIPADGHADAAAGLLSWLANIPDGSTIDFGIGTYRCDEVLEMHGRKLALKGGQFVQTLPPDDQRPVWRLVGCDIAIPAMRLTGSYASGGLLTDTLQHAHGFDLRGSHVDLGAVTVENLAGDGVYFGLGYDSQTRSTGAVTGATLRSLGRNGVSVTAGDGIVISGSTIATVGLDGVDIEPNVASGNWGSDNVVVQGNRFSGVHLYHYSIVEQAPVSRQAFTGNAVTDGPLRVWAGTAGGTVVRPKAVTVRSNTGAAGGTLELSHIDGLAVSGNSGAVSATDCTAVTA